MPKDWWKEMRKFRTRRRTWDQEDYEKRVNSEADMMVALEALKEQSVYLNKDVDQLNIQIEKNTKVIQINYEACLLYTSPSPRDRG